MQGDKEKCLAFGMFDHIPKPIEEPFFIKTLKKWAREIDEGGSNNSNFSELTKPEKTKPEMKSMGDAKIEQDSLQVSSESKPDKLEVPDNLVTIDFVKKKPSIANLPKAYLRALSVFVSQLDKNILELEEAIESADFEMIKRIAHSQKGTCGSLGMDSVFEMASVIESEVLKDKRVETEKLEKLKTLLGYAKKDAQAILLVNENKLSAGQHRGFDLIRKEIVSLLTNSELIPADLISEFRSGGKEIFDENTLNKMVSQLESFDYDDVLKALDS